MHCRASPERSTRPLGRLLGLETLQILSGIAPRSGPTTDGACPPASKQRCSWSLTRALRSVCPRRHPWLRRVSFGDAWTPRSTSVRSERICPVDPGEPVEPESRCGELLCEAPRRGRGPAYAMGHDSLYAWRCAAGRAVRGQPVARTIDADFVPTSGTSSRNDAARRMAPRHRVLHEELLRSDFAVLDLINADFLELHPTAPFHRDVHRQGHGDGVACD